MRFGLAALAASGLLIIAPAQVIAQAQDAGRGERLFQACQSCHSLDPAKTGMAGPHLAGLAGRLLGGAEGFDYSPGFQAAKRQGLRWDTERLVAYLADPDAVVKGGWMSPPGLDDPAEREAVAAFLLGRR